MRTLPAGVIFTSVTFHFLFVVQDEFYILLINDLTLQQFIDARKEYSQNKHDKNCLKFCAFIQFANDVLKDGIVDLKLLSLRIFRI